MAAQVKERERLQEQNHEYERRIAEYERDIGEHKKRNADLLQRIGDLNLRLDHAVHNAHETGRKNGNLCNELGVARNQVQGATAEIAARKTEIANLKQQLDNVTQRKESLNRCLLETQMFGSMSATQVGGANGMRGPAPTVFGAGTSGNPINLDAFDIGIPNSECFVVLPQLTFRLC